MADAAETGPQPAELLGGHTYAIVLCCAQSVQGMVEEVGRNLRSLGFRTEVVCGAEARTALLGREQPTTAPTIYVVCVQGSLKDSVLKPLRQALATHGGPNEHLFVAVLDLGLPLAMVGQIRRFAEALERLAKRQGQRRDPVGERTHWRDHFTPRSERAPTRSWRPEKREVPNARADPNAPAGTRRRRVTVPRTIPTPVVPTRIGGTQKYQAVTGPPPSASGGRGRKRRGSRTIGQRSPATDAPRPATRTLIPELRPQRVTAPPSSREPPPFAESGDTEGQPPIPMTVIPGPRPNRAPAFEHFETPRARPRLAAAFSLLAVLAGLGYLAWHFDLRDRFRGEPEPDPLAAMTPPHIQGDGPIVDDRVDAAIVADPRTAGAQPSPTEPAPPARVAQAAEQDEPPSDDDPPSDAVEPADDPPAGDAAPPPQPADSGALTAALEGEPDAPVDRAEPEARASDPDEAALLAAASTHRLRESNDYFITPPVTAATSWDGARRACRRHRVDGVAGWRLPFRRELKLIGAIGRLDDGHYWSRSSDTDDPALAFQYVTDGSALKIAPKVADDGAVICIRDKP